MYTVTPSPFLESRREGLRHLALRLSQEGGFDALSILGTDDRGISFTFTRQEAQSSEPMWVQRGFCIRAQKDGALAEYATNLLPVDEDEAVAMVLPALGELFAEQPASPDGSSHGSRMRYPRLPDSPMEGDYLGTAVEDPFSADPQSILERMQRLQAALTGRPGIAMARCRFESVHLRRLFVSPARDLAQSFVWSQAYLTGISRRDETSRHLYHAASGRCGLELLDRLGSRPGVEEPLRLRGALPVPGPLAGVDVLAADLVDLLDSIRIEPGEHTVILSPDMAGTLAHEAFGHGVETDMFLKGRALAADYLGKRVGSDLVTMYDGAAGVDQTGSFFFDDEGQPASKTLIIDKGILRSGISDLLSAGALGIAATGNGRRQAFDHKAYARMTNTYFAPGTTALADMVAATQRGWYLEHLSSGMEDPRNWGVQLVCLVGREIVDGRFTGRVATPVVCSGFVPDVLAAVDMVSPDFELAGSGACGKGYKEYVKVSSGGPFLRTKMRLG